MRISQYCRIALGGLAAIGATACSEPVQTFRCKAARDDANTRTDLGVRSVVIQTTSMVAKVDGIAHFFLVSKIPVADKVVFVSDPLKEKDCSGGLFSGCSPRLSFTISANDWENLPFQGTIGFKDKPTIFLTSCERL